ncbi:hypothetical protein L198_08130 [Cryptococcus wingfieldii CBS 7118]|uniref:Uncharacterized protein n=1 Tax=Cryptococcus wingfieldii CBS 7118 TaxID=1295528 RepID=A0A1E3HH45_9TREE|nr:hypothetical protein L198_08130 [Cryptococcus wingfieldii CBS 7118]ODN75673.1 hypothetical protein L198_08130 [Cryptococcus wingfieldii CBS 7118]
MPSSSPHPKSLAVYWCSSDVYQTSLVDAQKFCVAKKIDFDDQFKKVPLDLFLTESEGSIQALKLWAHRVQDVCEKYAYRRNILPIALLFLAESYLDVSIVLCQEILSYHGEHGKLSPELYTLLDSVSSEGLVILDHLSRLEVARLKPRGNFDILDKKVNLAADAFRRMEERLVSLILQHRVS